MAATMGMRIRPANPADAGPMSKVHVDTWRTSYAGIVPAGHLAGLSYRDRETRWEQILTADRPAESNFVAETVAGDVVGFAGGGQEREGNPTYRANSTAYTCSKRTSARAWGAASSPLWSTGCWPTGSARCWCGC